MSDLFEFTPRPQSYAVFGNPVAHSKSPMVHTLFAAQFDIKLEYRAVHVDLGGFDQAVSGFKATGGRGLNITVPFKHSAFKLADRLSSRAQIARAVNTLVLGDELYGDNTDGIGLIRDIKTNLQLEVKNANVLILGAGGASSGIVYPILQQQPNSLTIANRTKDKAVAIAHDLSQYGTVNAYALDEIPVATTYEIVINATSATVSGQQLPISDHVFKNAQLAYDLMYAPKLTPFQSVAKKNGTAVVSDGLGMLVEQAAESFSIWHEKKPATASVIAAIRNQF